MSESRESQIYQPVERDSHSTVQVGDYLYMWGGDQPDLPRVHNNEKKKSMCSVVEVCHLPTGEWVQKPTTGDPPLGVWGYAAAAIGREIFFFGGSCNHHDCYHNSLYSFNVDTLHWKELSPTSSDHGPMMKCSCGMTALKINGEDYLAVIGGHGSSSNNTPPQPGAQYCNEKFIDVYQQCNEIHLYKLKSGEWISLTVTGDRPPPIAKFTLTSITDTTAILFGGCTSNENNSNDVYKFIFDETSVECKKYSKRSESEMWPDKRNGHSSVLINCNSVPHLLVVGGRGCDIKDCWLLNINKMKWNELKDMEDNVTERHYTSLSLWSMTATTNWIIMFGGMKGMRNFAIPVSDTAFIEIKINAGDLAVVQPVLDITEYQKRKQVNEETHNDEISAGDDLVKQSVLDITECQKRKQDAGTRGTEADEIDRKRIEKWLEEGEVELKVTCVNMHGAPGAGKTCSLRLLLNEPPPAPHDELTDSTSIACAAVQATRISIDDKNKKWKKVELEDILHQLASTEVDEASGDVLEAQSDEPSLKVPAANQPTKIELTKNELPTNEQTENISDDGKPNENKPNKTKPIENKTTDLENKSTEKKPKPSTTEVVEKILHAYKTGKSKKSSQNWVYFIDSGGQPAYRELLPFFTRAAALNIITIDLTKGLDEKCKFQYRIGQNTFSIETKLEYSNRGIIQTAISSEAMLNLIEIPYVSDMPKHSHYIILGTRKELVTEGQLKEMNEGLIEYVTNKKVISHNKREGSIIFPVNTMLPAGSKEREEASVDLCTTISNFGVAMTIQLPIRLFTFEISLLKEAKKKERSFLTKEEVIEIGISVQLDKEADIIEALRYLHSVTIILYYQDILPDLVFVDPKPILDILSRLISITYVDHSKLHLIANPPPSTDERDSLIDFGLFKADLLAVIGQKIFNLDFEPSHMIKLLQHLHIIAKVEDREEGDYFFPCALPSYDKLNDPPTEIRPLLIAWEIDNSGTTTLAIPQGLFPLTIVHLLEQKDDIRVGFTPQGKEYYRYHDAMSLHVHIEKGKYTVDIINRYTHIEIRFSDCKKACLQIRKLVVEAIEKSSKDLKVDDDYIFAFKCSMDEQCYCIVHNKSSATCTRCRSQCKVLESDDSYRCWFGDQLASPAEAESSFEGSPTKRFKRQHTTLKAESSFEGSPTKRFKRQHTTLNTGHLVDIRDLLKKHGYSEVDYYDLGLRLGLLPATLDVIENDNKGDVRKGLRECLKAWLQQADNVKSVGVPTYDTLIQALRDENENAVADGIERDLDD